MKIRAILAIGVGVVLLPSGGEVSAKPDQVAGQEQMQLRERVEKKLKNDADLKNNPIEVKVENSVVTLKGHVDTQEERSKAVSMARVEGVARVEDQLEVGSAGVGTALSDSVITTKVKAKLAADEGFRLNQFNVMTNNGVVTLEGTVATEAEHQRALDLVRNSDGVKRVADKIRFSKAAGGKGSNQ